MVKKQKVIQVGDELVVLLDDAFVEETGISEGDEVMASYKPASKMASFIVGVKRFLSGAREIDASGKVDVDDELRQWVEEFVAENEAMLKQLG